MAIQMTPVKSSNVKAIGYDPDAQHLQIEFRGGLVYLHRGVPPAAWQALLQAESKGGHHAKHIKGRYAAERLSGAA